MSSGSGMIAPFYIRVWQALSRADLRWKGQDRLLGGPWRKREGERVIWTISVITWKGNLEGMWADGTATAERTEIEMRLFVTCLDLLYIPAATTAWPNPRPTYTSSLCHHYAQGNPPVQSSNCSILNPLDGPFRYGAWRRTRMQRPRRSPRPALPRFAFRKVIFSGQHALWIPSLTRIQDLTELDLPSTMQTHFPDPADLLNFTLTITPDEGMVIILFLSLHYLINFLERHV